jgi:hypothetical protein
MSSWMLPLCLVATMGCAVVDDDQFEELGAAEQAATASMPSPFFHPGRLAANFTVNTFPYLVCDKIEDTWTIDWQECRDGQIWMCRDVYCRGDTNNRPRERQCQQTTRPCGDNYMPTREDLVRTFPVIFRRDVPERQVPRF